jgi:hypothetical protein
MRENQASDRVEAKPKIFLNKLDIFEKFDVFALLNAAPPIPVPNDSFHLRCLGDCGVEGSGTTGWVIQ